MIEQLKGDPASSQPLANSISRKKRWHTVFCQYSILHKGDFTKQVSKHIVLFLMSRLQMTEF